MAKYSKPWTPIQASTVLELVGKDEQIDDGDFGAEVELSLNASQSEVSGELLSFLFTAAETGSGAILPSHGWLLIFDTDPSITSGDTAITAAEGNTLVGQVEVLAADWIVDATSGHAYIFDQPVPFHANDILYLAWYHDSATGINDGAGDDETLSVRVWYRQES